MTTGEPARVIFVSYAHEDSGVLDQMSVVLKPLVRNGRVEIWTDKRIGPARRWSEEIEANLQRAEVAVLLVSAHFLASDCIMETELPGWQNGPCPCCACPSGPARGATWRRSPRCSGR